MPGRMFAFNGVVCTMPFFTVKKAAVRRLGHGAIGKVEQRFGPLPPGAAAWLARTLGEKIGRLDGRSGAPAEVGMGDAFHACIALGGQSSPSS